VIEQADFYVKNFFSTAIQVSRKLSDGNTVSSVSIAAGSTEKVSIQGTDVTLVIEAPAGIDISGYFLRSKAEVDLAVLFSRTDSCWKMNIVPNDLEPEAPTTVNVNVGEDE
jgi:hypothetical protein